MFKFLSIVLLFCSSAFASGFSENKDFIRLQKAVSSLQTLQGEFTQAMEGEKVSANFFFVVPGKLRINYTSPNLPVQMVITPTITTYYDTKLNQKSQVKTPKSAVELLLTKSISLTDKNVNIVDFKTYSKELEVTFKHNALPNAFIKAVFTNTETPNLLKIELNDTKLEFKNLLVNSNIDGKEFQILDSKIDAKFDF
jgi:hypothetical protein